MQGDVFSLYRCCFTGHGIIANEAVIRILKEKEKELIEHCNVNEFWVGNYGDFDRYATRAVNCLKKTYPQIRLALVLPYVTKEINDNKEYYYNHYDEILISDVSFSTPKSLYIIKTNEYMVQNCGYMIGYITHTYGGAARTWRYASRQKHIKICNLAQTGKMK